MNMLKEKKGKLSTIYTELLPPETNTTRAIVTIDIVWVDFIIASPKFSVKYKS